MIEKKRVMQCTRFWVERKQLYIVYTDHIVDADNQLHHFNFLHKRKDKNETEYCHTITYRYMFKNELLSMLEQCGFKVMLLDDTFNFGKYFAVIAQKIR